MGPGPQPGHRAQLSPQRLVKDITACPSPQHHLLSPGLISGMHAPHDCLGRLVFHVCVSISSVFLMVADSTSPSLFIPVVCFSFLSVSVSLADCIFIYLFSSLL